MARASLDDEIAAVRAICHALGLGDITPAILKAAHHTTLRLDPLGLVARVQTSGDHAEAGVRATREIAVARHLAARGAPVIAPCDARLTGPHTTSSGVVTLWPYVDHQRMADEDDALVAATALAAVHDGLADYPGDLPRYTRGLDRCWTTLSPGRHGDGLCREDRALLATHYTRLRRGVEQPMSRRCRFTATRIPAISCSAAADPVGSISRTCVAVRRKSTSPACHAPHGRTSSMPITCWWSSAPT